MVMVKLFEIYLSQMAENALKLSTMVGENFEFYYSQMAKNAFKVSPLMVWDTWLSFALREKSPLIQTKLQSAALKIVIEIIYYPWNKGEGAETMTGESILGCESGGGGGRETQIFDKK